LIEKHEIRRKREAGLSGERREQMAAALDSAGAALGSVGMFAFAVVVWLLVEWSCRRRFRRRLVGLVGGLDRSLVRATQDQVEPANVCSREGRPAVSRSWPF
jgi:peptidoglycan/LPS O-acetylase OafA/YrhL